MIIIRIFCNLSKTFRLTNKEMKTFGELKIGDIVYTRKLEDNLVKEEVVEYIDIKPECVLLGFKKDDLIPFNSNKTVDIKSSILYTYDKEYIMYDLKTLIQKLQEKIVVSQHLLEKYKM